MNDPKDQGKRNDRFYGERVGIVETESKDDPEKLYRVQVRVYGVFPDSVPVKDLPWAEYKLPIGARVNDGTFRPVKKGDLVWVDFPYGPGDTRRPRITGSKHQAPDKVPNLPHEVFGGPEAYQHKRAGDEPTPGAHAKGEDSIFTQHGVMIQINKDSSVCIVQKATGTELAITKDGSFILHGEKGLYRSAQTDDKGLIIGKYALVALEGVDLDGGPGDLKGMVNGSCPCVVTGQPHPIVSLNVKCSM